LLSVLCACNPTINFDLTQSGSGTIPGTTVPPPPDVVPINFALPQLQNLNSSNLQGFPSSQTAKDHIRSAHAKKITITATKPPGQTLSFLSSVAFSISATGQQTRQFAHLSPFPEATSADLQLDDVDLAPYLKADSFSITTAVSGRLQQNDIDLKADIDIGVEATLF